VVFYSFNLPSSVDLGAPYGPSVIHMLQSPMRRTELQFSTCCSPRCTVRTFSSSHAAVIGVPYRPSVLHILQSSVHRTDLQFFTCCMSPMHRTELQFSTCCSPRCTVRTFSSSHAAVLGEPYGPSILHMLQSSVHRTDIQFFTCCRPHYTLLTDRNLGAFVNLRKEAISFVMSDRVQQLESHWKGFN